jgi:hypothetical protein
MFPTRAQVDSAALARSKRRGKLILVQEDFDELWSYLFLEMNYRLIVGHKLVGQRKQRLGKKQPRQCRYCLKTKPETSFRQEAHSIPECLGNRSLISLDECDHCNQKFSQTFEDHFDKFTQPMRTMTGTCGKNGVPTFKSRDGKARVHLNRKQMRFSIEEKENAGVLSADEPNKAMSLTLKGHPYVPLEIYRCLVKMAFAILPDREVRHFDLTRRWLVEPLGPPPPALTSLAKVHIGFVPGSFTDPVISLWHRQRNGIPAPYMLSTLATCGWIFMYALPLSSEDTHLIPGGCMVPRFDLACHPATVAARWQTIDLRSTVPESSSDHRYELTYESSEEITGEEPCPSSQLSAKSS